MWQRLIRAGTVASMTLVACGEARADEGRPLGIVVGDRVRFTSPIHPGLRIGNVLETDPQSLLVRSSRGTETVRIALASIERLEVSRGRRTRAREAALVGFVPGALWGFHVGRVLACDDQGPDCSPTRGALKIAAISGASTAAVGALVGLFFHTERWDRVQTDRLRIGVVPLTAGKRGAMISIRY